MTPDEQQKLASRLTGADTQPYRAKRQWIGLGVTAGFFIAIVGAILTASAWWFIAPFAGFALAWRVVMGHWPYMRQ
jgi:hypothetical protein